jgi:hypothetical protein
MYIFVKNSESPVFDSRYFNYFKGLVCSLLFRIEIINIKYHLNETDIPIDRDQPIMKMFFLESSRGCGVKKQIIYI